MQKLVQGPGRIVRSKDDWGEAMVLDDNEQWAVKRFKQFLPLSFLERYHPVWTVPAPMEVPA
jgi:Rad3-related DNA helicase